MILSKFIIYNPKTNLFDFFINTINYELTKHNIETIHYDNLNNLKNININYKKDILFIIINPHFIYDYKEIYNELIHLKNLFKYKILYLSEPINFLIEKRVYNDVIKLIQPFCLWTYTFENFNKINTYHKIFNIYPINNRLYFTNKIEINDLKKRNFNKIVFFGNINENRKDICNEFDNNNLLINYTNKWSKEEWIEILENNLIYLNIHRRVGCKSFEAFRILPILANGGIVISEHLNEKDEILYKNFNIYFIPKNNLLTFYTNFINNINNYSNSTYEEIYMKTILFRKEAENYNNINDFLTYFNNL